MRKFHPFFIIGSFGIIVTALVHMFLALGLSVVSSHSIFFALYPTFLAFLTIGVGLTYKKQKETDAT